MGWACTNCGDVNPGALETCEECGIAQGTKSRLTLGPQPVSTGLVWLATLLGGVLAGYLIAIWNGRVLRNHTPLTTAVYGLIGVGGWILTIVIIANLTQPQTGGAGAPIPEPGFGIPIALALSFLLVSIPYNRDTLAVNQWIWAHPRRRLVLNIGRRLSGLGYRSFAKAQGELFGDEVGPQPALSIPVLPIVIILLALIIGVATVSLGSALAPK